MALEPVDDVEQQAPLSRKLQCPKGPPRHPGEQGGTSGPGPVHESAELRKLGLLAHERGGIFESVHPHLVRQRVRTRYPVTYFAHRDAHV